MRFLARHKFTPINFIDYFAFRDGLKPLTHFPSKPIIITFDDGYKNNIELALPILKKYGFTAVLYALGDFSVTQNNWDSQLGEPAHLLLNSQELKRMRSEGIEIGAHSLKHEHLTDISEEAAWGEIFESKQNLEKLLQEPVISFAYPYGAFNHKIKLLTQKAGYRCAVATDRGGLVLENDLFAIFRVNVMPRDKMWEIFKKTLPSYRNRYWRKRGQ